MDLCGWFFVVFVGGQFRSVTIIDGFQTFDACSAAQTEAEHRALSILADCQPKACPSACRVPAPTQTPRRLD